MCKNNYEDKITYLMRVTSLTFKDILKMTGIEIEILFHLLKEIK